MIPCSYCNAENSPSNQYCDMCGKPLPSLPKKSKKTKRLIAVLSIVLVGLIIIVGVAFYQQQERERAEEARLKTVRIEQERLAAEERKRVRIIRDAGKYIGSNGSLVMKAAHPTAQYLDVEYEDYVEYDGLYKISFDMHYRTFFLENSCYLRVYVYLDTEGDLQTIEWGRDTGFVPPGFAAELIDEIIKNMNS